MNLQKMIPFLSFLVCLYSGCAEMSEYEQQQKLCADLGSAIKKSDISEVKKLLELQVPVRRWALNQAIRDRNYEILELLLKYYASYLDDDSWSLFQQHYCKSIRGDRSSKIRTSDYVLLDQIMKLDAEYETIPVDRKALTLLIKYQADSGSTLKYLIDNLEYKKINFLLENGLSPIFFRFGKKPYPFSALSFAIDCAHDIRVKLDERRKLNFNQWYFENRTSGPLFNLDEKYETINKIIKCLLNFGAFQIDRFSDKYPTRETYENVITDCSNSTKLSPPLIRLIFEYVYGSGVNNY